MRVDSYLELFTTLYGWAFANIIGGLLTGIGLIYIPFLVIAFQIWRDTKESASAGGSAIGLSEAVQVKLILSLFVFVMCFATIPGLTNLGGALNYQPLESAMDTNGVTSISGTTVTAGNTGTTYDQAMASATNGSLLSSGSGSLDAVPLWWYFVMAVSSGINDSIRGAISNSQNQLRDIEALARTAGIQDPKLNAQVRQFTNECFHPARSRYLNAALWNSSNATSEGGNSIKISTAGQAIVSPSNTDGYGPTDVDWMGSKLFQTEPGFYDTLRSKTPVDGFDLSTSTSFSYEAAIQKLDSTTVLPASRHPTCNEWWEGDGSNAGLRSRLVSQSQPLTVAANEAKAIFPGSNSEDLQDALIRAAQFDKTPLVVNSANSMGDNYDGMDHIAQGVGGIFGWMYTGSTMLENTMAFNHMVNALGMLQAIILMCIYMLLPLIVVLSGYKLEVMWYGGMGIFTVKFWTVLWFVAQYIDADLWKSMYPGANGVQVVNEINHFSTLGTLSMQRTLINIILFGMFVGFPLIFSGMMSWIGINVGRVISDYLGKNSSPAKSTTGMHLPKTGK